LVDAIKDETLTFRLSETELNILLKAAKIENRSLSNFVRYSSIKHAEEVNHREES